MSRNSTKDETHVGPFLRWAGGKRWLLHHLPELLGSLDFSNYYEPFLGGGSIFFGLNPQSCSHLSDLNSELIETYRQVKKSPDAVSKALRRHRNNAEYYYKLRNREYDEPVERAARFIFLNHTSYNGLHRVNLAGQYNVPYGHRKSPRIPGVDQLRQASQRLRNAKLSNSDFVTATQNAAKGDLVFLDPPYTVAHNSNGFVEYNKRLFSFDDQTRLAYLIESLRKRGSFFIMTNAYHKSISDLFESGDRKLVMSRGSTIGGTAASRGRVMEYLFTNVPANG